jgi:hypothetical protein
VGLLALRVAAGTVVGLAVGVAPRVGVPVTETGAGLGALGVLVAFAVLRGAALVAPARARTADPAAPGAVCVREPVAACVPEADDGTVEGLASSRLGAAGRGRNGASIVGPPRAALSRSPR